MPEQELTKGERKCAALHFGPWLVEVQWLTEAVRAVQSGLWTRMTAEEMFCDDAKSRGLFDLTPEGVAIIQISGHMAKGKSSFGGTSTVRVRQALRDAARSHEVRAILLQIDSPGGTASGTSDLAEEVLRARRKKPVHAYIEDTGASAAYWVASQAERVTANPTALIGSIGTLMILDDESGRYDKAGIKVHVVSSGKFKGAFAPGAPITAEQVGYAQDIVNQITSEFLSAISAGRQMPAELVEDLADGKSHMARKAVELGLIDGIETLDEAIAAVLAAADGTAGADSQIKGEVDMLVTKELLKEEVGKLDAAEFLALRPDVVAAEKKAIAQDVRNQVHAYVSAFGEDKAVGLDAFLAGKDKNEALIEHLRAKAAAADAARVKAEAMLPGEGQEPIPQASAETVDAKIAADQQKAADDAKKGAQDRFMRLVEEKLSADKSLTRAEAMKAIAAAQPELRQKMVDEANQ